VPATDLTLPEDYPELFEQLKQRVRTAQAKVVREANTELLRLYWTIGRALADRRDKEGWGAKVVERLAVDLQREFPGRRGFSSRSLAYMRAFALAWPDHDAIVQQPVARLPWGHVTVLLDKLDDQATRDWYAAASVENGWSRAVLLNQIKNATHRRVGAAPSNFADRLEPAESELARELAKDPFVFDFLGLSGPVAERELEQALMDRIQQTLAELGRGFAFVGRQVRFEVDGDDFAIDLLFFHVEQLRYVVVELKIGKFEPGFAGQLNFYVSWVDDQLRRPQHAPTVGLLLCADRNERVVRYALGGSSQPLAVSTYTFDSYDDTRPYEALSPAERAAVPAAAELEAALDVPMEVHGHQVTLAEYLDQLAQHDGTPNG
jgi:predicted nuclease of restriction endonuclease-like (RecB) superfamily